MSALHERTVYRNFSVNIRYYWMCVLYTHSGSGRCMRSRCRCCCIGSKEWADSAYMNVLVRLICLPTQYVHKQRASIYIGKQCNRPLCMANRAICLCSFRSSAYVLCIIVVRICVRVNVCWTNYVLYGCIRVAYKDKAAFYICVCIFIVNCHGLAYALTELNIRHNFSPYKSVDIDFAGLATTERHVYI